MSNSSKISAHEQAVSFDQDGNVVVNKESTQPKKLVARRAVEAYLERKQLERSLEEYYFD